MKLLYKSLFVGYKDTSHTILIYDRNRVAWFLPSEDEIKKMKTELYDYSVGGLSGSDYYWSSTELTLISAGAFRFNTGALSEKAKTFVAKVRPSRSFTIVESSYSYALRATGQAGGLVYYRSNANGVSTYYEAYSNDLVGTHVWSNISTILADATGTAIGTGETNTQIIIEQTGCTAGASYQCSLLKETSTNAQILVLESPGYNINWNAGVSDIVVTGIIQSECSIYVRNKNNIIDTLLTGLVNSENRYVVEIQREDECYWRGILLSDFGAIEDLPDGGIELKGTDGIGILDDIDFPGLGEITNITPTSSSFMKCISVAMQFNPVIDMYLDNISFKEDLSLDDNSIVYLARVLWRTAYMDTDKNPLYASFPINGNEDAEIWVKKGQREGYNGRMIDYTEALTCREVIEHILSRFNCIMMMVEGKWHIYQRDVLEPTSVDLDMFGKAGTQYEGHTTTKDTQLTVLPAQDIYRHEGQFGYLPGLAEVKVTYLPFYISGSGDADSLIRARVSDFTGSVWVASRPLKSGTGNFIHFQVTNKSAWTVSYLYKQTIYFTVSIRQGSYYLKSDGSWQLGAMEITAHAEQVYNLGVGADKRKVTTEFSWDIISEDLPGDEAVEVRVRYSVHMGVAWYSSQHTPLLYYIMNNNEPVNYVTYTASNDENKFTLRNELKDSLFGSNFYGKSEGMIWTWLNDIDGVCECEEEAEKKWGLEGGDKDKFFNQLLVDEVLSNQATTLLFYSGGIISRDSSKLMSSFFALKIRFKGSDYLMAINNVTYNPVTEELQGDFFEINKKLIVTPATIGLLGANLSEVLAAVLPQTQNLYRNILPTHNKVFPYIPSPEPFITGVTPPPILPVGNVSGLILYPGASGISTLMPPNMTNPGALQLGTNLNGKLVIQFIEDGDWIPIAELPGIAATVKYGNVYNGLVLSGTSPITSSASWNVPSVSDWETLQNYISTDVYDDWYLPSASPTPGGEMWAIKTNLIDEGVGDFDIAKFYHTSSEDPSGTTPLMLQYDPMGFMGWWITTGAHGNNLYVRPVRDFTSAEVYNLREFVGGGYVYYIEDLGGTYKYYICAPIDYEVKRVWGDGSILGITNSGIGDGKQNTLDVLAIDPTAPASLYCNELETPNTSTAGGKLKATGTTYWKSPNTGASDLFNFSARGGSYITEAGVEGTLTEDACFWAYDIGDDKYSKVTLAYNSEDMSITEDIDSLNGMSVRLVRDASVAEQLLADGTYCDDYVGNNAQTYSTVKIGTQVWLAENLIETTYRDLTNIPVKTDENEWAVQVIGAVRQFGNERSNAVTLSQQYVLEEISIDTDVFEGDGTEATPLAMKDLTDDINYGIRNGKFHKICRNIDGGFPSDIYLVTQLIDGGTP